MGQDYAEKRYIIECINELLKNKANLVHSRHRSIHNFIMNLRSALTAYCFFENKPEALSVYEKIRAVRTVRILSLSRTGVLYDLRYMNKVDACDFRNNYLKLDNNNLDVKGNFSYDWNWPGWSLRPGYDYNFKYNKTNNELYRLDKLVEFDSLHYDILLSAKNALLAVMGNNNSYWYTEYQNHHRIFLEWRLNTASGANKLNIKYGYIRIPLRVVNKSDPTLPSIILGLIDNKKQKYNLILCGSFQLMMHSLVLNEKAPLYQRCARQSKLKQLRLPYIKEALHYSDQEAIEEYVVWGDVPR